MEKETRDLEAQIAEAFIAYKNAEQIYNFYRTQLKTKMAEENYGLAIRNFEDGTSVVCEYVAPTAASSFDARAAKTKLKELMGDSYNDADFTRVSQRDGYVKVSVNFAD